ncbi:2-oxoadipate dioxygenase/decarboxylase family protein [Streptomyces sp. NPDC017941]|uniref:2-oxoadipate dioxygenase/decarboxylase family protein n=1 Tax=Streptomyces sp. NPDC017941 TaxID=3365018 RepID=UPI0037961268
MTGRPAGRHPANRLAPWQLRAAFAVRLSAMYGREVPAYDTLVEVTREVNEDVLRERGGDAERLGTIARVTAERHGAVRVGTPAELEQAGRVFGALGMRPVGFYDLREAAASAVPVVSTAFRPVDGDELARNPFRVFTSLLTPADPRFFDPDLRRRLERFLAGRELFPPELLALADRAEAEQGLAEDDAERFLRLAVGAFELSAEPVDKAWYETLERVSAVAADIGGVGSTHINHLTPRVLDIDELYRRMTERGIEMIDTVQGPPRGVGPDVLLRQTSFRALDEPRALRLPDGTVTEGTLRVRFGEVEARGIALTRRGRARYDELLDLAEGEVAAARAAAGTRGSGAPRAAAGTRGSGASRDAAGTRGSATTRDPAAPRPAAAPHDATATAPRAAATRAGLLRSLWPTRFPGTERALAERGLAHFTYHAVADRARDGRTPPPDLPGLLREGWVRAEPIVYEDFLPRSAAGIFQSNLDGSGTRQEGEEGVAYDSDWLSGAVGRDVLDPFALYEEQQARSLARAAHELRLERPIPPPSSA